MPHYRHVCHIKTEIYGTNDKYGKLFKYNVIQGRSSQRYLNASLELGEIFRKSKCSDQ